ncbi:putative acetyltransferase [Salipiger thiooxidans]|uniref:Putative acetyltransferase n=1 Tax=Salipiger thiooxidans TaxID=282683 RepID=A0A1G7EAX3_9RHOB|nr:GNAT family N-acetyltransferase [Salipiger thiooxidans]SDE60596.1 putative acetyltransferase [Salipiger thiooxidans]
MSLAIHPVSPRDPRAIALLTESHALMNALFPPEENHFLDIDALCCESITLFGAEECGELLGCAALARRDGYGEVKSMFVAPEARGIGVARRLLDRLERTAREEGFPLLRLETGDRLAAAVSLYEREGYRRRAAFGSYPESASSLFYEKPVEKPVRA